jgi:leukotriene-A4 hydrolase
MTSWNQPRMIVDPSSFATDAYTTTHVALDLTVDFDRNVLAGSVVLTLARGAAALTGEEPAVLVLDTRALDIAAVHDADTNAALPWSLAPAHVAFGSALRISMPAAGAAAGAVAAAAGAAAGVVRVRVMYSTSPAASGVQWLTPAQTSGKAHPFLFTQSQAIHARSILPCQDAPGVKAPFSAAITVPAPLTALMSGLATGCTEVAGAHRRFTFEQPIPVPAYLIAAVVGQLEQQPLSARCAVWAEAGSLAAAAHEFADTERFLAAAETLLMPYVWGRYDLVVLPPSFPYGGMENPCLTFVTPTLLAGDRSLVSVIAHEIAHSWTGNLVTNSTWEHFWLNEGCVLFGVF